MSFTKLSALTSVIAFASKVYSHGHVSGIVVDGVYYEGYSTNFVYMADPPVVVGWSAENQDNGFVAPSEYTNADIICHKNATNAGKSATVSPGGTVELQWTAWPESHHGPVINYLAKCAGDCTTDDKTTLEFFKVEAGGLVDGSTPPGTWASDTLIANNNTGALTIPTDIAPGHYVLRHEIIALHSAGKADGAQNYPQCFNLEITGSGTATYSGEVGTKFYTPTDPGILINIYTALTSYVIPGPALISGASSGSTPASSVASSAAASTEAGSAPATSAASVSTAATVVTSAAVGTISMLPPYSNSSTFSTKKSKSACKSKSKRPSTTVLPTGSNAAISTTSAASVTIPTSAPVVAPQATSDSAGASSATAVTPTSAPTSTPSSTPSTGSDKMTLDSVLAWISDFYNKFKGATYDGSSTLTRRHPRAF